MGNALDQGREVIKTIKIRLYPDSEFARAFQEMMEAYRDACNAMSEYMFSKDVHMGKRRKVPFTMPEYFQGFLDDGWKLGTAHILCRDEKWYLYIPATALACAEAFDPAGRRDRPGPAFPGRHL